MEVFFISWVVRYRGTIEKWTSSLSVRYILVFSKPIAAKGRMFSSFCKCKNRRAKKSRPPLDTERLTVYFKDRGWEPRGSCLRLQRKYTVEPGREMDLLTLFCALILGHLSFHLVDD